MRGMRETPSTGGRVAGKVAIITGAASGIGRGCAEVLAREGARVILTDRNEPDGRAAAEALGAPHTFRVLDVTDEAAWTQVVDETVADAGRLDILINAAGIGVLADIERTTVAQFRQTYAVNVEGVFLGCRAAIGAMKKSGGGSIINLSSVAGMVAGMAHAMGGSDAAREILSKAAPLGRLGTVAEVAALVLYLASDESAFTTGAELVIDGGLTAR
jgi:3(or 17)beta-hydroxysteroid dehydrogenase